MAADGIPLAQFAVDDIEAEHARLVGSGVLFTQPPTAASRAKRKLAGPQAGR
jgi:hypothetical protein